MRRQDGTTGKLEPEDLGMIERALRDVVEETKSNPSVNASCAAMSLEMSSDGRSFEARDLGNSNISGPRGPKLGSLKHLQYLELYRNNFEGKAPKELRNLKNLVSMDLYGNQLQGEIPKSFGKLKSLRFLRLNNNKLTGSIPKELASFSNLKVLIT